jgi:hypothetical protein
VFES